MSRNNDEIIILSFIVGVLAFLSLRERRIDTIRRNIGSISPNDNIKRDWLKVGSDLTRATNKITK